MELVRCQTASEWHVAASLVQEYVQSLNADLSFQHYEREIADLPEQYGSSNGCFLLAELEGSLVGCVGLRRLETDVCEMKRLYVQPPFHGQGIGRALALGVIAAAKDLEYGFMRLDTWPTMAAARALYRDLGFRDIAPYRHNPVAETSFMELEL